MRIIIDVLGPSVNDPQFVADLLYKAGIEFEKDAGYINGRGGLSAIKECSFTATIDNVKTSVKIELEL